MKTTGHARSLRCSLTSPPAFQVIADPRWLWPREADFHRWLAGNLDVLAACLRMGRLEFVGREVLLGERGTQQDWRGREQVVGGLRLDVAARDEHGRYVAIEAQFGDGDHTHLGQLLAYAHASQAEVAVWIAIGTDPLFSAEHLCALAELNEAFAGRRRFCVVVATLESRPRSTPPRGDEPLHPRLRQVDLLTHRLPD